MGNEMGNQNVKGQEEVNTPAAALEKLLQEAVQADKQTYRRAKLFSGMDKQTAAEREQGDSEPERPQSTEAAVESNEEVCQDSGVPTTFSSNDMDNNGKLKKSSLGENWPEAGDHQIQEQPKDAKEETSNLYSDMKSASLDPQPVEFNDQKSDIHKLGEVQVPFLETDQTSSLTGNVASDTNMDIDAQTTDLQVKEIPSHEEKSTETDICQENHELISGAGIGNALGSIATASTSHGISGNSYCSRELPIESVLSRNSSSESQSEAIPLGNPVNFFQEIVSKVHDKCTVIPVDKKLISNGSENGNKYDPDPIQSQGQVMSEWETVKVDTSQSDLILVGSDHDNGREVVADSVEIEDSQVKDEEAAENAWQLHSHNAKPNSSSKHSEDVLEMLRKIGTISTELTATGHNHDARQPTEKELVDEIEENSSRNRSKREPGEATEQHDSQTHDPIEDLKQNSATELEAVEARTLQLTDSNQESTCREFGVTKDSNIAGCANSAEAALISALEMVEKERVEQDMKKTVAEEAETSGDPNIHIELRKSSSFGFDLSLQSGAEESDQTPLLQYDRTANRSLASQENVNPGNPTTKTEDFPIPTEEKKMKMDRRDPERLRTPFMSFLKEDEQAHLLVSSQEQSHHASDAKEKKRMWKLAAEKVAVTPSKTSGTRKPKSSVFSICICCTTAIR